MAKCIDCGKKVFRSALSDSGRCEACETKYIEQKKMAEERERKELQRKLAEEAKAKKEAEKREREEFRRKLNEQAEARKKAEEEKKRLQEENLKKRMEEIEAERKAKENARKEKEAKQREKYFSADSCLDSLPSISFSACGEKIPLKNFSELGNITYSNINEKTKEDSICNFIAIDIETTGLQVHSNIIEVSAVKFVNFEPESYLSTLCYAKPISEEITDITGITQEMVKGKPYFYQIIPDLQEYIGDYNIVGHNLNFDIDIMRSRGVDFESQKRKYYDTLRIAKAILKVPDKPWKYDGLKHSVKNGKLDTLLDFHHITRKEAHRSLSDAIATGFLFKALYNDYLIRADTGYEGKIWKLEWPEDDAE